MHKDSLSGIEDIYNVVNQMYSSAESSSAVLGPSLAGPQGTLSSVQEEEEQHYDTLENVVKSIRQDPLMNQAAPAPVAPSVELNTAVAKPSEPVKPAAKEDLVSCCLC